MATKKNKIAGKKSKSSKGSSRVIWKGLKGKKRDQPTEIDGVKIIDKSERRGRRAPELEGTMSMTREGYGFVKVPDMEDDIYIPHKGMRGALNGDKVRVCITKRKIGNKSSRSMEGEVIKIIERSKRPHVGIIHTRGKSVWAIVESKNMPYDIRIDVDSPENLPEIGGIKAEKGVKVAVLVKDWPRKSLEPIGEIVDVLGKPGENDTEMHSILAEFNLPYRFEPEVENAADNISDVISEKEIASRRDFRKTTTFTIDPSDAKDFDDALSFKVLENGNYEIGVHIADVSYYVTPESIVDKEAYARATSVYLVDRTIPMLPEALCNKLCSLRPHEDKLTYSAVFEMNDKAKIIKSWFGRTIINSDYRFDYEQAQDIIENMRGPLAKEILTLHELATILRKQRFDHGAINFERPEMKVKVDENGKPIEIYQKESKDSNWLIEEFMLLANRSVAENVAKKCKAKNPTFVYRIHDNPNPDKLGELGKFARNFGHTLGEISTGKEIAYSLNSLMKTIKGKPEENAIQMMALRSMARAKYSTDNIGHYGLAFPYYTHFTSPIRRYPDLMVHRLLTMYLDGAKSQDKVLYEDYCAWCSEREQIATEAERASIKYKLVEYLQDKIGQEYEGTVSGVTEWGIYVEIEPTKIEGMIFIKEVKDDYLFFDEENYRIVGKATGRTFTLGDRVKVRVIRASLEQKLIDYELVWDWEQPE